MSENEQSSLHLLDNVDARLLSPTAEKIQHPEQPPSEERISQGRERFESEKNKMVIAAIYAHLEAISYRLFRVGACTLADHKEDLSAEITENDYTTQATHNAKFVEHHQFQWGKLCAENNGSYISIKDGCKYIAAIVTACNETRKNTNIHSALKQHDETKSRQVVHPCENCRNLFRELIKRNYMSEKTTVYCVNDSELVEEYKVDLDDPKTFQKIGDQVVPRLKLKNGKTSIGESDITDLPFEEMTLGELLALYPEDLKIPFRSGYADPPYEWVFTKEQVFDEFSTATKYAIVSYSKSTKIIGHDRAWEQLIEDLSGIISDALNHGGTKEELLALVNLSDFPEPPDDGLGRQRFETMMTRLGVGY